MEAERLKEIKTLYYRQFMCCSVLFCCVLCCVVFPVSNRVSFQGDLVWFDPGVGHVLPGEVMEYHRPAQVLTVQAVIAGKVS